MRATLNNFPDRHAGLILGSIMVFGLLFCLGSGSDPSTVWGVSQVYPDIGAEPFAEARGRHLEIEAGLEQTQQQPLLTLLATISFKFFGHGVESLSLFSVIPYMLSIFTVSLLIARTRGRIFGLIGAGWLALQPTFLAWSSVPSTIPLAAFLILLLVGLAGQPQRWAPWLAFVLGGILSWGISPLITVVIPICWIEGCRREVSRHWQPTGLSLLGIAVLGLFGLQLAGADLATLARIQSGVSIGLSSESFISMTSVDPGLVLILAISLLTGFRKTQLHLRPLSGLIVTATLPWIFAGELPIFPLVVLLPSCIWLMTETFADRSRVKVLNIDQSGQRIREALLLFVMAMIAIAVAFTSQESGTVAAGISSMCFALCIVGSLLSLRAGFQRSWVGWIGILCLASVLIPVNLNRMAHSTDRWQIARESLDRLIPSGEAISGRWAHLLVLGTDRPAYQNLKAVPLRLSDQIPQGCSPLDEFQWGGKTIALYRALGNPACLFEEAVDQQATGETEMARQSLSLILRKTPDCSAAWERLGLILLGDGHEDIASECFFFALQGDPWRAVSHQQLARLYSKYGLFREARYHLEMSQGPDSPRILFAGANASTPSRR